MANMVQQQIRENSMELHNYLSSLQDWEKTAKEKDKHLKESKKEDVRSEPAAGHMPPVRGRAKPPTRPGEKHPSQASPPTASSVGTGQRANAAGKGATVPSAAHHTYDYFRDKWDKFDVDAAMKEVDGDDGTKKEQAQASTLGRSSNGIKAHPSERKRPHAELTPMAKAGHSANALEADERAPDATSEKDRGNELFKSGRYADAMRAYSSSIALQPTAVAYANRAMAAIKLKRYEEAEVDCTEALNLDDRYVKAYSRRGTARRELKKYLESVEDFEFALRLEPDNKEVKKQYADAKDLCEKEARLKPSAGPRAPVHIPVAHAYAHAPPDTAEALRMDTLRDESLVETAALAARSRGPVLLEPIAATSAGPSTSGKPGQSRVASAAGDRVVLCGLGQEGCQPGPASAPRGKASTEGSVAPRGPIAAATAGATEILMKKLADRSDVSARSYAELLSLWKAFEGDPSSQAKILRNVEPQNLPKVFKDELTPWFVLEIARTLKSCFFPGEMERAADILEGLTKCSRFGMVIRCILPKQKDDLRYVLEAAVPESYGGLHDRMDSLRREFLV